MKDETLIIAIIDRSTSMSYIREETIAGFNQFINEQKALGDNAVLYAVQFDGENNWFKINTKKSKDIYLVTDDFVPISEVKNLTFDTFTPQGWTAMYDAIGTTLDTVGMTLSNAKEEDRPNKVIVMILTDGNENSSIEYSREQVKKIITEQKEKYNWEFIFLGANINVEEVADNLGIVKTSAYMFDTDNIQGAFKGMSHTTMSYRMHGKQADRVVIENAIKNK